jgi:type IV pilus assembly protein PilM
MAKRAITLFIRDTAINLLVMKAGQVEKWGSLPLEPGLVSQGLVVDEEQVASKVKQLFKETGAKTNKVTVALSGHDSLYRIITLPELPEAVIPEAVRREAQRTIPTPLEEVYYSYQRIPSPKGESRLFLATFPRNMVDTLIRTLHQADIKPYVLDLAPLALCRIPDVPRAIIIDARLEHLDVMVLADRLPQVIRTLSLPGETGSLEEKIPSIAEEFIRTVAFYNSSHLENPLDSTVPVFVCGDLAEAPKSWGSLAGPAGYSVSPLSPSLELPDGFSANEFMVNIGLAFKELLQEKEGASFSLVNFNALPEAYVPPSFSIARVLVPVGIVVGIGLVVLMGILILHNRDDIETLRPQVLAAESAVRQQQSGVNQLRGQVGSVKASADVLHNTLVTIELRRTVILDDLREITALAGDRVKLGTISYSGSSVSLNGNAPTVDDTLRYARALRDSRDAAGELRFSSVWITSYTNAGAGFSISLTK